MFEASKRNGDGGGRVLDVLQEDELLGASARCESTDDVRPPVELDTLADLYSHVRRAGRDAACATPARAESNRAELVWLQ
jgi:hypothetical protein